MPTAQDIHPLAPLLFADVPMDKSPTNPLGLTRLLIDGRQDEAARRLITTYTDRTNESRLRLWAAATLRSWNITVETTEPMLGLVIEFPVEGAMDYVAAYADGSARYLNYSGSAVIWDTPRKVPEIDAAVINFLNSGMRVLPLTAELGQWSPTTTPRITCLTLTGNRSLIPGGNPRGVSPFNGCVDCAIELMNLLIERSLKKA